MKYGRDWYVTETDSLDHSDPMPTGAKARLMDWAGISYSAKLKTVRVSEFFKGLFFSDDCVERLELSRLHQIVLGLVRRDLGEVLSICQRPEIGHVDSKCRTALSWAVFKGMLTLPLFL